MRSCFVRPLILKASTSLDLFLYPGNSQISRSSFSHPVLTDGLLVNCFRMVSKREKTLLPKTSRLRLTMDALKKDALFSNTWDHVCPAAAAILR